MSNPGFQAVHLQLTKEGCWKKKNWVRYFLENDASSWDFYGCSLYRHATIVEHLSYCMRTWKSGVWAVGRCVRCANCVLVVRRCCFVCRCSSALTLPRLPAPSLPPPAPPRVFIFQRCDTCFCCRWTITTTNYLRDTYILQCRSISNFLFFSDFSGVPMQYHPLQNRGCT